jgi:hypothetical protein
MDFAKTCGQGVAIVLGLVGCLLATGFFCAVLSGLWNGTWP